MPIFFEAHERKDFAVFTSNTYCLHFVLFLFFLRKSLPALLPDLSGVSVSEAYWRARKNGKGKYTGDYDDVYDEWEARCDTNPDEDPYDWTIESDSFSL